VLAKPFPNSVSGVLFLQMSRITEDKGGESRRMRCGIDRTGKTVGHESRKPTHMVQVGVTHDDSVDTSPREREPRPVTQSQVVATLEHSTVEE
jgi:hypothetical protein